VTVSLRWNGSRVRVARIERAGGRRVWGVAALAGLTVLWAGCGSVTGDVGRGACEGGGLKITANGHELVWIKGATQVADASSARQQILIALASDHDVTAAPYLPIGTGVAIAVGQTAGAASIQETPITASGEVRWNGWQDVAASQEAGVVSFKVPDNPANMVSSNSADYEPGSAVRGAVLTVTCDAGSDQYAFAFRTDPSGVGIFGDPPS
jgi:hypothetical protein